MKIWIEYLFIVCFLSLLGFVAYDAHQQIVQRQQENAIIFAERIQHGTTIPLHIKMVNPTIAGGTFVNAPN